MQQNDWERCVETVIKHDWQQLATQGESGKWQLRRFEKGKDGDQQTYALGDS